MPYCYGNLERQNKSFAYDESDYQLEKTMVSYWSNFAKTGNPNGDGLPTWDKYVSNGNVMELGSHVGPLEDKYLALYDLLDGFIDKKIASM